MNISAVDILAVYMGAVGKEDRQAVGGQYNLILLFATKRQPLPWYLIRSPVKLGFDAGEAYLFSFRGLKHHQYLAFLHFIARLNFYGLNHYIRRRFDDILHLHRF